MKKLCLISILSLLASLLQAQQNLAPSGTVTDVTGISYAYRINDGSTSTSATIAPYTTAFFTVLLDDVYSICTIDLKASGSPNDVYQMFLSETGLPQDFMTYGSSYSDPPTFTNINQDVKGVKFMVGNYSPNPLYINELEVYACATPILFSYDAAGNRENRTIGMPSSLKKGVLDEDFISGEFTDMLEELSFKIYPNPTKGLLTVEIENFTGETNASISIYDLQGRQIHSIKNANASNAIDLSGQSSGTYLLILRAGDKTSEWKIVKE